MPNFETGCKEYTFAQIDTQIAFPNTEVCCQWCPFISHNDGINRDSCKVTGEIIYSRKFRGVRCPLTILNTVNAKEI